MRRNVHSSMWHLSLLLPLAGCSDAMMPPEPLARSLSLVIRTTGLDQDPDGYLLTLDDGPPVRVSRDTTIDLARLGNGAHRVILSEIASWCTVPDGTEREFEFAGEGAQQLVLDVECRTTFRDWLLYDGWRTIELQDLSGDPAQAGRLGYPAIECGSCTSVAISPDGERAAWITASSIEIMHADGSGRRTLREVTGATLGTVAWSPDGERLAYVAHSDGAGVREDIFIMSVDGPEEPLQITDVGDAEALSWSPDGSTIVVSRWHFMEGVARLWLVGADGSNLRLLGAAGVQQRSPAWSPDGQSIAYVDGDFIRIIDADGSNDRAIGPDVAIDPAWSPDGQRIAFAQYDIPAQCVYAIMSMRRDGTDVRPAGPSVDICAIPTHRPARHPAWGHDGS